MTLKEYNENYPKKFIRKVANLAASVQGAIKKYEKGQIWEQLLALVFEFINNE